MTQWEFATWKAGKALAEMVVVRAADLPADIVEQARAVQRCAAEDEAAYQRRVAGRRKKT